VLAILLAFAVAVGGGVAIGHPKVDPGLLEGSPAAAVPREFLPQAGVHLDDGRVLAVVEHEGASGELAARLAELGARPEGTREGLVEAWLPRESLAEAAELPGVRYIRRPHVPVPLSEREPRLVTEGVTLLGASRFHAAGILGQDVTVAVIDVGFGGLTNAYRAGEIAQDVVIESLDYTRNGLELGGPHGTGVAQIVHNMAPKANLHLARIGNEVQLDRAVRDCVDRGVDIIVHSVGWVNTDFGDGTGVIADTVRRATDAGILWVNAAGNHATRHWLGTPEIGPQGWLEFEPGVKELAVVVDVPSEIHIALTWDEWPQASSDFDLFLFDPRGNEVASSRRTQDGDAPPTEFVAHFAERGRYTVRVRAERATEPVPIEIFSLGHDLEPYIPESSILAPGNVAEVLTVGAIGLGNWDTGPQQPYSSQGPTNDGRLKPDIMGPDTVRNFAYPRFTGTSAAAPHVAAGAALLLSQARRDGEDVTSEQLKEPLLRWAVDMGVPGADPVYGHGRIRLLVEQARAERAIRTPQEDAPAPGETVTVEVTVRMPATQVGGMELRETLPEGLEGAIEDRGGADFAEDGRELTWRWDVLTPGEERTVRYSVPIPEGFPSGSYELSGELNQDPVGGQAQLEIGASPAELSVEAVCRPNPVRDGQGAQFSVTGVDVWELRLRVHDTSGRTIYDSDWQPGPTYQWNLQDNQGRIVAGGIYLYWVEINTADGQTVRTGVERLLVVR